MHTEHLHQASAAEYCQAFVFLNVLFQHLWYNAITDGYDTRFWIEAPRGTYDSYGIYAWGDNAFFRDETSAGGYVNRVLVCDGLDHSGWEALITPHLVREDR